MFEQSILTAGSRHKTWTLAVSLAGQITLVFIAVLVPLVYTDQLPGLKKWAQNLAAPVMPAPVTTAPHQQATVRRTPEGPKVFRAPGRIPAVVKNIVDDPSKFVPEAPEGPMVVGSFGVPSLASGVNQLLNSMIIPKPPRPAAPPAAKTATETAPMRVSQGVQEAKLLRRVIPIYPPLAITARVQGTVHLVGVIAKDGTIRDLKVIDGSPLLVRAALDAVRQWIYQPTLLSGEAVEVIAPISVTFTLR